MKRIKLSISIVGIIVIASILFYRSNNRISRCERMQEGITLKELISEFGEPYPNPEENIFYFESTWVAAGPIRATIDPKTNRVIHLQCQEDGQRNF